MRQSWRDLLFLHFRCDPDEIQALLPAGLTVDTFPDESGEEKAWVGLVPFLMKDVRLAFAPPFPGTHTFPETNVRTYVQREGQAPGVWFFSLDAANHLAVQVARRAFSLPYFFAQMTIDRTEIRRLYRGNRPAASYEIGADIGSPLAAPQPGSLEFFLVERYLLYANRHGKLFAGRVFHPPYALQAAQILSIRESLVEAARIQPATFVHAVYSIGVDVEVFPLHPLS